MSTYPRLAASFREWDYPYQVTINPRLQSQIFGQDYFDEHSSIPHSAIKGKILHSLHLAEISDYKLFDANGQIELHLPSEEAYTDFKFAYGPDQERRVLVEAPLNQIPQRILKKRLKHAADTLDRTNLRGRFYFVADSTENHLLIVTLDKAAYFQMQRLSPEQHILGL